MRFVPFEGSEAFIVEETIPLTGAGTAYRDDSIGLPLNAAGVWTLELSAATATGVLESAQYTFELTLPDGTQATTIAPQPSTEVSVSVVEQSTTTAPFATSTTTTTLPAETTVP